MLKFRNNVVNIEFLRHFLKLKFLVFLGSIIIQKSILFYLTYVSFHRRNSSLFVADISTQVIVLLLILLFRYSSTNIYIIKVLIISLNSSPTDFLKILYFLMKFLVSLALIVYMLILLFSNYLSLRIILFIDVYYLLVNTEFVTKCIKISNCPLCFLSGCKFHSVFFVIFFLYSSNFLSNS